MSNFHHHPDNVIYIRTNLAVYQDTLENFLLDCQTVGITYTGLPEPYVERYYEPGKSHRLCTQTKCDPQLRNWPEGNNIISSLAAFVAAQIARTTLSDNTPIDEKKRQIIKKYCLGELGKTQNIYDIILEEKFLVDRLILLPVNKTYTTTQENQLFVYRRNLRLFADNPDNLDNPTYPTKPAWL